MTRYRQRFTAERWTRIADQLDAPTPWRSASLAKRLRRRLIDKPSDHLLDVSWSLHSFDFQSINIAALITAKDGERFASLSDGE